MSWGREQSHFQLTRETTRARGLQGSAFFSSSGFYHCWGILAGRERETPWLPPSAEATLCHPGFLFHLKPRQREERDSHFKRQFDLRNTQERNLKEDLRRQLKGEYKGHTVTDAGQRNLAIPESVQRRNSCEVHETPDSLSFVSRLCHL